MEKKKVPTKKGGIVAPSKRTRDEMRKVFEDSGFNFARMISGSKSGYIKLNPENLVIFNSRIYDLETFKKHCNGDILDFFKGQPLEVWYGDLDLSKDIWKLYLIALKIGTFVITRESGKPVITIHHVV